MMRYLISVLLVVIFAAGAWIAMPLGMLLGGILTDRFGTSPMLIGLGITYLITTLSMAFIPSMKEMNRKSQ